MRCLHSTNIKKQEMKTIDLNLCRTNIDRNFQLVSYFSSLCLSLIVTDHMPGCLVSEYLAISVMEIEKQSVWRRPTFLPITIPPIYSEEISVN